MQHQPDARGEDVAAILARRAIYVPAFNARDDDRLADLWAPDRIVIPPDREAYVGDAGDVSSERGPSVRVENDPVARVEVDGDLGYTVGSYTFRWDGPDGPRSRYGRSVEVWRRQPDGEWRVVADMWHDLPAGTVPERSQLQRRAAIDPRSERRPT